MADLPLAHETAFAGEDLQVVATHLLEFGQHGFDGLGVIVHHDLAVIVVPRQFEPAFCHFLRAFRDFLQLRAQLLLQAVDIQRQVIAAAVNHFPR